MLARSRRVFTSLPEKTRFQSDSLYRWLDFLKGAGNFEMMGDGEETGEDGKPGGIVVFGSINNLPAVSQRACVECAAAEI